MGEKMSIYKNFATDRNREELGVKFSYPKNEDGTIPTIFIAHANISTNKNYEKSLERHMRNFRDEDLDETKQEEIYLEVFCDSIIIDWSNIQKPNGENIEFNKENAIALMKELPHLYADLKTKSRTLSNFLKKNLESDAKN